MPTPSQHTFSEKVALVVNSASPVGRAVSMQLGLYGSYVIAANSGIKGPEASAVDELRSLGTLAHAIDAEPGTPDGAARMVAEVEGIYGRLDLLVNCLDSAPESAGFDEFVNTVLAPAFHVTEFARSLLERRPKAAVVNVVRYSGSGNSIVEEAVNAAVEKLTATYADLYAVTVRINSVAVREDRNKGGSVTEDLDPELFRPRGAVEPDDVARAVVYLLSSEAKGVNGQVLEIG